jgi:Domain of unknown function (DUF3425)
MQIQPYPAEEACSVPNNSSSPARHESSNNKFHRLMDGLDGAEIDFQQEAGAGSLPERILLDVTLPTHTSNRLIYSGVDLTIPDICEPFYLDSTLFPQLAESPPLDMANQSEPLLNAQNFGFTASSSNDKTLNCSPAPISTSRLLQSTDGGSGNSGPSLQDQTQVEQQFESDNTSEYSQLSIAPPLHARNQRNYMNYTDALRLADPYQNAIQFSNVTIIQICILNAHCLGIAPEDVVNANCLSLCSPFYRPVTASDEPNALLAAVSKPSTPKHLQPTLSQILFPHHPILDLIPLPGFRERAIMLSSTSPALLNPLELKRDIMEGGLMCWGSRNDPFHEGNGQPWDLRSWEAAPWFLNKWKLLVGGKDGELWKQSLWWRNLRGDTLET